jgi:outer membrane protein
VRALSWGTHNNETKEIPMLSIRTLVLTIAATLAVPAAFAQEPGSNDSASASGKRFAVVGGYSLLEPRSNPGSVAGAQSEVDGGGAATLSGSWYATDNIAVELWGAADKFDHRVKLNGAKAASVSQQPIALSGQYHFGGADNTVRPFVGLGYYESNFDAENADAAGPAAGARVGVTTQKGAMATVGADFNITPTWFARTDLRYMHGGADVEVNGVKAGEIDLDPYLLGVGIGARF